MQRDSKGTKPDLFNLLLQIQKRKNLNTSFAVNPYAFPITFLCCAVGELNVASCPAVILSYINRHFWISRGMRFAKKKCFSYLGQKKNVITFPTILYEKLKSCFIRICRFFFGFLRLSISDAGKIVKLCDQYSALLPSRSTPVKTITGKYCV
jgi:hypothetical protein